MATGDLNVATKSSSKYIMVITFITFLSNLDKNGDRKAFVATIVSIMATGKIWLDTNDLKN